MSKQIMQENEKIIRSIFPKSIKSINHMKENKL